MLCYKKYGATIAKGNKGKYKIDNMTDKGQEWKVLIREAVHSYVRR